MTTQLCNAIWKKLRAEIYEARSERRGKYHDDNRAKAKARKRAQQQAKIVATINAKE